MGRIYMKDKYKNQLIKKDFGGKEIIAEMGLAVIAVALIIVFRGEINDLVTSLMDTAQENIGKLFTMS